MAKVNFELLEKALLFIGGLAAGYAMKEVIDYAIENVDVEQLRPILHNKFLNGRKEEE